jgi:hypothetical protein
MGSARAGILHLFSAFIAVGVAATILFAGRMVAIHFERSTLAWTAPQQFQLKNQGMSIGYCPIRKLAMLLAIYPL